MYTQYKDTVDQLFREGDLRYAQKLFECLKRLDWPLTSLERGNVLFQGRIIFSRNLILKVCVPERKKKERKKIVLHIMILFICYLCFQLPFFFFADQQFCSLLFLFLVRDRTQCTKLKNLCHWLGRVHVRCIILKKMYWNPC